MLFHLGCVAGRGLGFPRKPDLARPGQVSAQAWNRLSIFRDCRISGPEPKYVIAPGINFAHPHPASGIRGGRHPTVHTSAPMNWSGCQPAAALFVNGLCKQARALANGSMSEQKPQAEQLRFGLAVMSTSPCQHRRQVCSGNRTTVLHIFGFVKVAQETSERAMDVFEEGGKRQASRVRYKSFAKDRTFSRKAVPPMGAGVLYRDSKWPGQQVALRIFVSSSTQPDCDWPASVFQIRHSYVMTNFDLEVKLLRWVTQACKGIGIILLCKRQI